jgi:dihydrofolate reductase
VTLSLIYARSEDYCIGKAGQIPWWLPDEFAHFKRTTLGKPIIMGRKTYEDHNSALPGRLNIVISRNREYAAAEKVQVVSSLAEAMALGLEKSDEVFVVGGSGLFETSFPKAARVYETIVHTQIPEGDTFVPAFDFSGWTHQLLEQHPKDERHAHAFSIHYYERPR